MTRLIFFVATLLMFPPLVFGQVAPEKVWKTLNTENFEVIYEPEHRELAEEFARNAERAHALMSPVMSVSPPEKTIIWIYDRTDSPNGLATVFPRNIIIIFPVLPSSLDSIGHYDSWSQKLITHEYAHILNMEPSEGIWKPFRFLLGNLVRPNALLPTWYLEGLAVEMETQFTKFGRLRSPYFNSLIRAMVEEGIWFKEPLAFMNETRIATWPYGLRPYFWGSLIMHEIASQKGLNTLGDFNQRYAGRVPFFIHEPLQDLFGVQYEDFLNELRTRYEKRARSQIDEIKKQSQFTKPSLWSHTTSDIHSPTISPDGLKLAFIRINEDRDSEIHVVQRNSKSEDFAFSQAKVLLKGTDINTVGFSPDSNWFVFDRINSDPLYQESSDLHRFDLKENRSTQLTFNIRAQEPALDFSGQRTVFIKIGPGRTELAMLKNEKIDVLYTPPLHHRVSRPKFLSEHEIIFSERFLNGSEHLRLYDFKAKNVRTVINDHSASSHPMVSRRGVVFVSAKNGVPNLYWSSHSLFGARPVTNTTTSVQNGVIDEARDKIYFSQLTGKGSQIFVQPLSTGVVRLKSIDPLIPEPKFEWSEPTVKMTYDHNDYSPYKYLWPKYWLPLYATLEDGYAVSAFTSGQDPLSKHAYYLTANYDSLTNKMGGYARLDSALGDGRLVFNGSIDHRYYYSYNLTTSNTLAEAQYDYFPTRKNKNWKTGIRASKATTELPHVSMYEYAGPGAYLNFSNVTQKPTEISPMSGISTGVDFQYFIGSWGNVNFPRTKAGLSTYFSKWLPKRNSLALNLDSYWSPRNRSVFLGTTAGGDYSLTFLNAKSLIVRGYPINEFLGWNAANGSLEYRLPISDRPSDLGTFPAMFRRWHGAIFLDALTIDGFYYAKDAKGARTTGLGNFFYGTGVEVRSDLTLAYHLPAMIRIGLFYGLNENAYGGFSPYLSLSVPEF